MGETITITAPAVRRLADALAKADITPGAPTLEPAQLRIDGIAAPDTWALTISGTVEVSPHQGRALFPYLAMGRRVRIVVEPAPGRDDPPVVLELNGSVELVAAKRKAATSSEPARLAQTRGVKVGDLVAAYVDGERVPFLEPAQPGPSLLDGEAS